MRTRWAALPRGIRWLVGTAAAVLALVFLWALFVPVAAWLARYDVGSAKGALHETALDNARGRLLTLGAGLVAVVALVFTALNFNLLRRNSEQTDQWQRRTFELAEQGHVTDRYTRAIEQLGSKELDVRIGGIYALERIARDSARDHPVVMEVLASFIRERSREHWSPAAQPSSVRQPPRPDVQAAMTVIGRRDAKRDIERIILYRAVLPGAHLTGANLTRASLAYADLAGAGLVGADLTRTALVGANLAGAALVGTDLTGADLTGTDLTGANLADARWPEGTPVPEGWELDLSSGRLRRAGTNSETAEEG